MLKCKNIKELLKTQNIETNKLELYEEALTHSSYVNEHNKLNDKPIRNYERLEILGDSIVGKIVTEYFYKKYQDYTEEQINDAKKRIVQNASMVKASEELDLINYTRLGNGVDIKNGTNKIKEDIFEAFIGALYLDQGESFCFELIKKTIIKYYLNNEIDKTIDYKTKIQEIFQSKEFRHGDNKMNKIIYHFKTEKDGMFEAHLIFNDITYGIGQGKSKKAAEQEAAKDAWNKLETN